MTNYDEIVRRYEAAWNEYDKNTRLTLLVSCWGDNAVYTDPENQSTGVKSLSELIGNFHLAQTGARLKVISDVDEHHDQIRIAWVLLAPNGDEVMQGMSFGLINNSLIQRMTGFFGPFPSQKNY